jgi:hypothetical protein
MSLITPILEKHSAFDATTVTTFIVKVGSGGEALTKIRVRIKNNTTGVVAVTWDYNNPRNSNGTYRLSSAPNVLSNGTYYTMYAMTYNETSGWSNMSNSIQFLCIANPTLTRSNYSEGMTVTTPSTTFTTVYSQASSEPLNIIHHILTNTTTGEVVDKRTVYAQTTSVPFNINYTLKGLLKDNAYKYHIDVETLNGLKKSLETNISVSYEEPSVEGNIKLKNLCDYGVIKIISGLSDIKGFGHNATYSTIDEETYCDLPYIYNPSAKPYLDTPYALWDEDSLSGTTISYDKFTILCWFRPDLAQPSVNNAILNMFFGDNERKSHVRFCRDKKPNSNDYADFLYFYDSENNTKVRSNYIDDIGTTDDVYLMYLAKNGTSITLNLTKLEDNGDSSLYVTTSETTNDSQHMYLNKIGNYMMTTESSQLGEPFTNHIGATSDAYMTKLLIQNGHFNHLTIYSDIVEEYTTPKTTWEDPMQFNCNFNNNLNAGNMASTANITDIAVKKRTSDSNVWLPIYTKHINSSDDFHFEIYDPYCMNHRNYIYAIVPMNNGIEGEYYTAEIFSSFDGFYIGDEDNCFRVMVNVNYDATDTTEYGLLQPLNKKYPIVIKNGITRYNKGTLNSAIMGYKYMKTRKFDTEDIAKMRNDLVNFLNDGEIKVVKDWTGNIAIVQKIGEVTRGLNAQTGYSTIGFTWVEQGQVNDKTLYEEGKLRAIDHIPQFIINAEAEE